MDSVVAQQQQAQAHLHPNSPSAGAPQTTSAADQTCVVKPRESLRALSCFSSSPPPDSSFPLSLDLITPVQWSVELPATSICLTHSHSVSHSPRYANWLRRLQTSPGHRSILTTLPHRLISSVRACLPGHKALTPRPSPPRLFRHSPTALPTLTAIRRPLLFVDRRASRPD